jgi:hypothetical protein
VTTTELRKAEAAYRAASSRSEVKREERNRIVREAIATGWTHAAIAEATGMSRGRVGQIAVFGAKGAAQ